MFSRDVKHYHPTPRRLDQSKFGPNARLSIAKSAWRDAFDMAVIVVVTVGLAAAIGFLLAARG